MADNAALGIDVAMVLGPDGVLDIAPLFGQSSGRQALAEAILRRLSTPTGALAASGGPADYGFDVRRALNDDFAGTAVPPGLAAQVAAECARDERVQSADCAAAMVGGVLTLAISILDGAGPFTLVLNVSAVTVTMLTQGT